MTVLEAVKTEYPETKKFTEDLMDEECQKENISADDVIFFTSLEAQKNIFCLAVSMLRDIILS